MKRAKFPAFCSKIITFWFKAVTESPLKLCLDPIFLTESCFSLTLVSFKLPDVQSHGRQTSLDLVFATPGNNFLAWVKVYLQCYSPLIGHFRVPKTLTIKLRLGAQPFLWKWVLFAWEWKIISISKAEHLPSFWNRGPGELGNGLFIWLPRACSRGQRLSGHLRKRTI